MKANITPFYSLETLVLFRSNWHSNPTPKPGVIKSRIMGGILTGQYSKNVWQQNTISSQRDLDVRYVPDLLFPPNPFLLITSARNRESYVKGILDIFTRSLLAFARLFYYRREWGLGIYRCVILFYWLYCSLAYHLVLGCLGAVSFNITRLYWNPGEGGEVLGCCVLIVIIWAHCPNVTLFWFYFLSQNTPGDQ